MKFEPWRPRRRGKALLESNLVRPVFTPKTSQLTNWWVEPAPTCFGLQTSFSIICVPQLQSLQLWSLHLAVSMPCGCVSLSSSTGPSSQSVLTAHGPSFSVYLHTQISTFCPAAPLHLRPLHMQFRWASANSLPLCFECLLVKAESHALSLKWM